MAANSFITAVVIVLVATLQVTSSTSLTFSQGGYNQLQVALAPQTPVPSNCSQMLHQLEVRLILLIKFFTQFVATLVLPP
jgi:hypothetical protein